MQHILDLYCYNNGDVHYYKFTQCINHRIRGFSTSFVEFFYAIKVLCMALPHVVLHFILILILLGLFPVIIT